MEALDGRVYDLGSLGEKEVDLKICSVEGSGNADSVILSPVVVSTLFFFSPFWGPEFFYDSLLLS